MKEQFIKIELTKEEAIEYYEHVAAEQGTEFDAATVTGPITLYQIKGIGAEINIITIRKFA
ncbi:MAG: hypothetical protein MZV64_53480 [Ignavibacteriales bacterium]|nr:hypothetical protein [Ignavibacteriales bacterium]